MDMNKQIGTAAAFAQIVWVASGVYLYLTSPATSLLSVSAAIFLLGGLVAAPAVFGMAFYGLQRLIDGVQPVPAGAPTEGAARKASWPASLLLTAEAVLIFIVAAWAFDTFESYRAGVPLRYIQERNNFDFALKAFSVANGLEEEAKPAREAGQIDADLETRLVELIEAGVARGSTVSDEFLGYVHPELREAYRNQLLRGYEMLARGRRGGDLPLQTEGNDLVRMFYQDFLPPRADAILGKVGARLE